MVAVLFSARVLPAQDLVVNSFDSDQGGTFGLDWENLRTYAYGVDYTFDPTQDSTGNPNSGSMYITVQWPTNSDPNWNEGWNDIQFAFYTPPFNPTDYINFDVDIKVDTANSSPAIDGNDYGAVELIVNNPWTTILSWYPLALTNGWQHIHGSFSGIPSQLNSEAVIGFASPPAVIVSPTPFLTGLGTISCSPLSPPPCSQIKPLLSLAKRSCAPGLTCSIASKAAGTYQRQIVGPDGEQ